MMTNSGYIKRLPIEEFEAQSRGGKVPVYPSFCTGALSRSGDYRPLDPLLSIANSSFPFLSFFTFLSLKGKAGARLSTDDDTVSHFFSCNDHDSILFATDKYVCSKPCPPFASLSFSVSTTAHSSKRGNTNVTVLPVSASALLFVPPKSQPPSFSCSCPVSSFSSTVYPFTSPRQPSIAHPTLRSLRGVAYSVKAYQIPLGSRIAKGVPLPQVLPISSEEQVRHHWHCSTHLAFIAKRDNTVLHCTALDDVCELPVDAALNPSLHSHTHTRTPPL